VDARAFLGLEATAHPLRWRLPVRTPLTTSGGFLFGGVGLAAAIEALEAVTGRPLVWATAQYLSYALPPSVVELQVTVAVAGRQTAQARAVGRVGDQEIFTVNAALGSRPLEVTGEWAVRPDAPPPGTCPPQVGPGDAGGTIMSQVELRTASARRLDELDGRPGDGRSTLWARVEGMSCGAGLLGILGDWVPFGIGQALGVRAGGNSLDNTLRVVRLVPTDWVLLDIRIHGVANGFGHGLVHLWAEDGTLLATASQSVIVRFWDEARPRRAGSATVPQR
jgi:acyl-CoA thioesterase